MTDGFGIVDGFTPEAREVQDMFGYNGNFEDYWLGTPSLDNTNGQPGWLTIELYLRVDRRRELHEWARGGVADSRGEITNRIALERMQRRAPNAVEGGGITGLDPRIHKVDAELLRRGKIVRASASYVGD